jgi:hypothetical protein
MELKPRCIASLRIDLPATHVRPTGALWPAAAATNKVAVQDDNRAGQRNRRPQRAARNCCYHAVLNPTLRESSVNSVLVDIIGMTGTFLVVASYFLLQLKKLDAEGLAYNAMNLIGAIFLLISLCYKFNLASFVIELFWIAASLIGIFRYLHGRRRATSR